MAGARSLAEYRRAGAPERWASKGPRRQQGRGGGPRWLGLAVVGAVAVLLAACSGGIDRDPEAVTEAFMTAYCEGDYERAHGLLGVDEGSLPTVEDFTDTMQRLLPQRVASPEQPDCVLVEVLDVEEDGDVGTATIRMSDAVGGVSGEQDVPLVRVDGAWRVHLSMLLLTE